MFACSVGKLAMVKLIDDFSASWEVSKQVLCLFNLCPFFLSSSFTHFFLVYCKRGFMFHISNKL